MSVGKNNKSAVIKIKKIRFRECISPFAMIYCEIIQNTFIPFKD